MEIVDGFGDRLERAIKEWGPRPPKRPGAAGSINQFHQKVSKNLSPGAGTSYQTLWRIIAGTTVPSDEFIEEALRVLPKVRREWLVDGRPPATKVGEAADEMVRQVDIPIPDRPAHGSSAATAALAATWAVIAERYTPEELAEEVQAGDESLGKPRLTGSEMLFGQVISAVFSPLRTLEFDEQLPGEALDDFTISVATALRQYVRRTRANQGGGHG